MDDNSRKGLPPIRLAFNRATDRRSEPRYEVYLRDVHALTPRNRDFELAMDRKTGSPFQRDSKN